MNPDEIPDLIPEQPDSEPEIAHIADKFRDEQASREAPSGMPQFLGIPEKRLMEIIEAACIRLDECRNEMGLKFGHGRAELYSLMWDRQVARQMYAGNMAERRMIIGQIFEENNWSYNVPQRIIRMLAAQHSGDLVGSDQFCAVMPEKSDDPSQQKLSKQVEKVVQDEIARSNCRMALSESIRVALTEGERPVKVTWEVDKTQFIGSAIVAVYPEAQESTEDAQGSPQESEPETQTEQPENATPEAAQAPKPGDPIKTESGQYIFQQDDFLRFYVDEDGQPIALVKTTPPDMNTGAPATSDPAQPPQGTAKIQMRLKKEPSFVLDESLVGADGKLQFKLVKDLKQTIVHHKGLQVAGLFPEDFIYPIRCTSLTDRSCDIMAHVYDLPLDTIEAEFRATQYAKGFDSKAYDAKRMSLMETGPLSQQNEPNWKMGESKVSDSRKLVNIHETYYRCRVNPDDEDESWLFLVIDYVQRLPIYAEYLGNMKMKRPPFGFIRGVESEPGRAYGVGVYKKFADKNLAIDLWFNRAAMKSSKTASVTFQHENGMKAQYQGQKLTIGSKEIYTIPAAAQEIYGPNHPPVFRVNLNEMTDKEFELMDKLIQDGDLNFGVINTAPQVAQTVGKGTATAVRNLERTGNVLQRCTEEMMSGDIEDILEIITDTVLENQDEESIIWSADEDEIALLNRNEIRELPRDIRVLMTRVKGDESFAINQQASEKTREYLSFPPSIKKKVFSMYRNILKSLFIQDADTVIEEPTEAELAAEAQANQKQPPKESLNISLKDIGPLTPSEREQALQLFGIKASPAEEVQMTQGVVAPSSAATTAEPSVSQTLP